MFRSSSSPEARRFPRAHTALGRVSPEANSGLVIRSATTKARLLLPIAFDESSCWDVQTLSFEHVGDKYFLSKVETPAGVYTFGTPRAMTKVAQMKDHGTMSSSGAN